MAYLGSTPNYGFLEGQTVTFNGSTTQVTLNRAISTPDAIDVFIDNVHQEPDVAYTVDAGGGSITFTGTPVNGAVCYIRFHGQKFDTAQASQVIDSDGDTHVKVEASSDSDTVVVTAGGTVAITANSSGVTIPNLTVTGTTTSVNSTNLNIGDNQITLNSDVTGTPSENAGLIVNRGSASDVSFLWNETSDYWIVNEPLVSATRINAIVSGNTPSLDGDNIGLFQNSASSQNAIVSIISNSSSYSQLNFGDENDENAGYLRYNNSSDLFTLNSPITISGNTTVTGNITAEGGDYLFRNSSGNAILSIIANASNSSILKLGDTADFDVGQIEYNHGSNYLAIKTNDSERVRIDSSGRVGIGQSSPDSESLVDLGSGENSGFTRKLLVTNTGVSRAGFGALSNIFRMFYADDQNLQFGTVSRDGNYTFSEKMRISSNGHVSIGTTTSTYRLNVADGRAMFTSQNNKFAVGLKYGDGVNGCWIGSPEANGFSISTAGGGERLRVDGSGRVGIGNTSPDSELEVTGTIIATSTADQGARIERNGTTGGANIDSVLSGGSIHFRTGTTEHMRIANTGNVGIGTDSSNVLLTLKRDSASTSQGNYALLAIDNGDANGFSQLRFQDDGAEIASIFSNSNEKYLIFRAGGNTERMRIKSNGNVGIGNSNPATKLAVSGNVEFGDGGGFDMNINGTRHQFSIGGTELMRLDATGLGIGISSQGSKLHVHDVASGGTASSVIAQFTQGSNSSSAGSRGLQSTIRLGGQTRYVSLNSHHNQYQDANTEFSLSTDSGSGQQERIRVNNVGKLLVGMTSTLISSPNNPRLQVENDMGIHVPNSSNNQTAIVFQNDNGRVGFIDINSNSISVVGTSDYRLKENISYIFDATSRLKQLKPCRFNFKTEAENTYDGFLAHEVESIVPEAVSGNKDDTDEDNNIIPQGFDPSKLVPLLVKTIQELEARITTLENA